MKKNWQSVVLWAILILNLTGCEILHGPKPSPMSTYSTEQLIEILEDPASPKFGLATAELGRRVSEASRVAPVLAQALMYPRRDSYVAGVALVSMGAEAKPAIPQLLQAIQSDRADVRLYAAFVLGTIGEASECAVPELADLLWDSDPFVRSSAAGAIEAITGIDLVMINYEIDPEHPGSVGSDSPEGLITENARIWWLQEGQYLDWSSNIIYCNPDD